MEGWQKTLSPKTQKPLRPEVNWNTTCKVFYQDWLLIINLIKNEKEKKQSDSKERRKRCKHNTSKFEVTKWKNIYNDEIFDFFSSRIHVHVGIFPLFISPFVHIYLFPLLKFNVLPDTQVTLRDCLLYFVLFYDNLSANSYKRLLMHREL